MPIEFLLLGRDSGFFGRGKGGGSANFIFMGAGIFLIPSRTPPNPGNLSGPSATVTLPRYAVALHSVALRFSGLGGMWQENRATPPEKGPVAPSFSALKRDVALQVASGKVSRYRGVSQLPCRLSRCNGALSWEREWKTSDIEITSENGKEYKKESKE